MWSSPRLPICRSGKDVLSLALLTLVVALSGCGAPGESGQMRQQASAASRFPAPVTAVPHETPTATPSSVIPMPTQPAQSHDRAPRAEPASVHSTPRAQPLPIELIGTGIADTNAFAVVRKGNQEVVTVHAGESIGDFAVATIEPDRITLRSPGSTDQVLKLRPAGADHVPAIPLPSTARQTAANSALITEGINTDQSIPANVRFGPTASLPDGVKPTVH